MDPREVPARRLSAQQLARHAFETPEGVVGWLGALQAQDYAASKWAIGVRLPGKAATDAGIEQALDEGRIVRTHALRGTWQIVAAADLRWLLALIGPRVVTRNATRYRQLGLDEETFRRSNEAISKALRGGAHLTRRELAEALEKEGISTEGQRLPQLLQRAELDSRICSGARRGKSITYALLDERVAKSARRTEAEALSELATRYFQSRGPASLEDFIWWSGLTAREARSAHDAIRSTLDFGELDGKTYGWRDEGARRARGSPAYLLPAFDEYLLAYRHRAAVLDPAQATRLNAGGGMLEPCVVVDGQVVGTWRRTLSRTRVSLEVEWFHAPSASRRRAVKAAAQRYGAFLGLEVEV